MQKLPKQIRGIINRWKWKKQNKYGNEIPTSISWAVYGLMDMLTSKLEPKEMFFEELSPETPKKSICKARRLFLLKTP